MTDYSTVSKFIHWITSFSYFHMYTHKKNYINKKKKLEEEETRRQLPKNIEINIEQVLASTPHKTPTIRPLASHHENYTSNKPDTQDTAEEARTKSSVMYSYRPSHMAKQK